MGYGKEKEIMEADSLYQQAEEDFANSLQDRQVRKHHCAGY